MDKYQAAGQPYGIRGFPTIKVYLAILVAIVWSVPPYAWDCLKCRRCCVSMPYVSARLTGIFIIPCSAWQLFGADKKSPVDYNGERTAKAIAEFAMKEARNVVSKRLGGGGGNGSSSSSSGTGDVSMATWLRSFCKHHACVLHDLVGAGYHNICVVDRNACINVPGCCKLVDIITNCLSLVCCLTDVLTHARRRRVRLWVQKEQGRCC